MKVLVLNDCLSTETGAANLLKRVCDGIAVPHQIEWVNIRDLDMAPCQLCLRCRPCDECAQPEDDAHKVGRKLFAADALVVGLASTARNVSAPFERLLTRCAFALSFQDRRGNTRPWREGRKAIIASYGRTVTTGRNLIGKTDARRYPLLAALEAGGFEVIGNVAPPPEGNPSVEEVLTSHARKLGRNLLRHMFMPAPA